MKFKLPLIVVVNIAVSRKFYEEILNQKVVMDFGANITFEGAFSLVFMDYPNDNFHLKLEPPAMRSGLGGAEIGIYGGDLPFIDGGYPNIPSIYYLDIPATGSQKEGINVTIKAKSNQ